MNNLNTVVNLAPWSTYSAAFPYPIGQIIELNDSIIFNGVRFSPDLKTVYGVVTDATAGTSGDIRAVKRSSSSYNSNVMPTDRTQVDVSSWYQNVPSGIPNVNGSKTVFSTTRNNSAQNNVSVITDTTITNGTSWLSTTGLRFIGGQVKSGSDYWVAGTSGSPIYPTVHKYDSNGNWVGTWNVASTMATSVAGQWTVDLLDISDGVALFTSNVTASTNKWQVYGYNGTSSYTGAALPLLSSGTNNMVLPVIARVGVGQCYVLEMAATTADRLIRYVSIPNCGALTAATYTKTVCTADFTPLADQNITSVSAFLDYMTKMKTVTIGSDTYLMIALHAFLKTAAAGYNNPSKLIVYKINGSDPTQLTLVASQQITRSSCVLLDGNKFYCSRTGTVDVWTFDGTAITQTDSVPFDAIGLVSTTYGKVYGYNWQTSKVADLTSLTSQYRVLVTVDKKSSSVNQLVPVSVEVYDGTNARVAVPVTLTATNGVFDNGTSTTTVTTSTSGKISTNLTVSSLGVVNVAGTV